MRLTFTASDLVVASWPVPARRMTRDLPTGLEPMLTDAGEALVSIVALRCEDVRLDGHRTLPYSQLNVRTYARRDAESGIFILLLRVTPPGLAGIFLGAPVRPARIRVSRGAVDAPGLGVSLRYRRTHEAADVPAIGGEPLGTQAAAFLVSAGLRRLPGEHEPFAWEAAELSERGRFDPILALGFDIGPPASVLYAARTAFGTELPLERLA